METGTFNIKFQQAMKRGLDVIAALLGLALLWPLFAAIMIAIRIDSTGPVLYRHRRIGKNGVPFDLYKFRSMLSTGDDNNYMQYLSQLIESESSGKPLPYRKLKSDPRITRTGRILRNLYLDELPQIWNILKGDMSLVGPRPHVQFEVDHYTPEQRRRLTTRPGATGLWQVTGKADCTFNELIALDLEYIDRWNLWLDLTILFRTLTVMLRGGERFWARYTGTSQLPQPRGIAGTPEGVFRVQTEIPAVTLPAARSNTTQEGAE